MDCFEIYHGHWLTGDDGILKTYDRFLAEGRRISLIGGSDYHQPEDLMPPSLFGLGRPTTVLWLPHLDAASVVGGLKSGHGYIMESPTGPHLAFTVDGHPFFWGGGVHQFGGHVTVDVEVTGTAGDRLVWVSEAGEIFDTMIPSNAWQHSFDIEAPEKFLRAQIVAKHSRDRLIGELLDWCKGGAKLQRARQSLTDHLPIMRALSNPVYFDALALTEKPAAGGS